MKTLYTTYNNFAKRLVMSLMVLITVGVGSVLGETVIFDPSDFSGQGTSGTGSPISATKDGVTFSCNKGYGTTQFRCYKDGNITISSSKTISSISFSFSGSYTGGLETSYTELNTYSWEKSLSSQARITSCTVTYTTSGGDDGDDSGCITLSTTQNYPFNSTNSSNTSVYSTEIDGITFENKGGYKYNSYLSFNRSLSGAYLANTTAFSGNIESIVVNYNTGGTTYFTMYEGSSSLPSSTIVSPSKTGTGEVTYTFSGNNAYFKLALTKTGQYCNISSITICYSTDPETYTVTYDDNGATSGTAPVDNEQYESGAIVKILGSNGLERTYYSFAGWNTKDDGEGDNYEEGEDFTITENTTLYAKWDCATYVNIAKGKPVNGTFNLNVTGTQYTCENGFVVSVTDIVPATGYHFDHITQTDVDAANVTINDNAKTITFTKLTTGTSTINVVFAINSHKVTWKLADGKIGESTADIVETYNYGATISKPEDPTRDGFNFAGWKEESTNQDVMATMPDNDLVYIAQWTAKPLTNYRTLCTYDIVLKNNYIEDDSKDGFATITSTYTKLSISPAPSAREGYMIEGYYAEPECTIKVADNNGNLMADVTNYTDAYGKWIGGETTLYAKWQVNQCVVTWKVNAQEVAKTTVDIANPLTTIPYTPADDALGCCAEKFIGWSTETNPTKSQVYTTASELQNLIGTLAANTTKTFHAVFATPVPGAGTSLVTFSEMGYANEEAVTSVTLGDGLGNGDATITFAQGTAVTYRPTYYTIGEAVRTYAGNTITVDATYASTTLTQIDLTFAKGENSNTITASIGTITDGVWTGNAQSVTFTIGGTTGHRRIASIAVTTEVTGDKYTNYVTKCDLSNSASIGAGTITYANSATAIDTKCGQRSPASKAATLTFASAQNLTCPVTIEATTGFLVSTNRNDNSKYASSIIVKPVKSGTNKGKLPTIYVRYEANFGATDQIHGTITATGSEIDNTDVAVLANVTCTQYTLTVVDHLGNTISTTNYYEGNEVAEIARPTPDDCSTNYTFDGWSEAPVEYGTMVYNKVSFPYTMPAKDITLYPVYECNKTADYHRVTYDLKNNWAGDYLIAYSDNIFANGQSCGTNGIGKASNYIDLSKDISNNTINYLQGDEYKVTLEKYNEGYLLKTQDGEYNYYTNSSGDNKISTNENASTAGSYALDIKFESAEDIKLCLSGAASGSVFGYRGGFFRYFILDTRLPIYLYKKSPLYTTPLICGTIEAADAVVTSTAGQTIKVNVPITLKSTLGGTTTITAESDNDHFTVTPLENVTAGNHTIAVHYKPADDATTDDTEIANITLTASHGNRATTTFQVTGRHLPEKFVIATKVGANWYALPANMSEATNPEGVLIEVDEATMTATAPNTTSYTLFPVKTTNGTGDRYAQYGDRVRFSAVNNGYKGLWANNNATEQTVRNHAVIDAKGDDGEAAYEWKITTTVVDGNWQYTLQTNQDKNQQYLRYWVGATGAPKWGTYAAGNNQLYFLPVTETEPFDYKVVEWYPTKMLIQTDATIANPTAKIGEVPINNVTCTNKGSKLYEIAGLPLANNPTKVLTIKFSDGGNNYTNATAIPVIISQSTTTVSSAPFTTLTKDVYNYADLVVRDGATLTIDGGTHAENTFFNVTIYPTSKIYVPESQKLTVHSLTLFGGIDEIYNGSTYTLNKYGVPELSLKGTLYKSIAKMDYVMRVNLDQMYSLSVPYDVQLADIKYWDGSDIALGSALYVSAYDGEARANQSKKTWIYETDFESRLGAATLKAGVGYTISAELQAGVGSEYSILRMPMTSNVENDDTEAAKTVAVTAWGIDANITDNHKGWNLVGNPYMTTITGADDDDLVLGKLQETGSGPWEWVETTQRYVTIPMDNGKDYYQKKFSEAELKPFKSFFVQIATGGELSFALASRQNSPARHLQQATTSREVEFEVLLSNGKQSDNTGLLIYEEFTPAYEINADLEKMIGSMSVYTIYGGYKLAYNALSPINASEWIPVGYIAPAAGEYTLSLDDVEKIVEQVEHVYIIDYNANNIVDLMDEEYKFTTDKEQNDNRFAINVVLIQDKDNTTTGLDMIQGNNAAPIKFIYHDKMYIQSGGVIYDATGKQVTNINK